MDQMMDKIRSILSSSSGKKVGPPVPPRPPISAVQKALEKSRIQSHNFPPPAVPVAKGRTVIYTSKINNMNGQQHIEHQQQSSVCENKCFDTKFNESSTGLKVTVTTTAVPKQNGNIAARVHETPIITPANMRNGNNKSNNTGNQHPIMHHKSPVPRPRLKTPPLLPKQEQQKHLSTTEHQQNGNYTRLLMQNQNTPSSHHAECIELKQSGKNDQNNSNKNNKNNDIVSITELNRDDELKEKLLNEIFSGRLVEASNVHIRYNTNGSNLKRSSSVDVLNDRNSMIVEKQNDEKLKDRKVMFHEMLISELSEMRRAGNDTNHHQYHRLSLAKSCSDLSPSGNKQLTILEMRDDVKIKNGNTTCLISLEDSGVEDEEKADDCSSSGVGDSWDSCKDIQNRINMSLPGLPPLPKSLSGMEVSQIQRSQQRQVNLTTSSSNRTTDSTLDTQLAILRREMYSLRQMDLSLLSQLWALNESIQEFRTIMQEQENFSQNSPSPSNSELNSLASDDEDISSNDVVISNSKITLIEVPKSDRTNTKRRMNISPPAPPLSSKC